VDLSSQPLVLGHVLSRRHSDLQEQNVVTPFRMLLQEALKAEQLLRYSLDHV
jgi:hypothetical protein